MASALLGEAREQLGDVCLSWDRKVGKSSFRSHALIFPPHHLLELSL